MPIAVKEANIPSLMFGALLLQAAVHVEGRRGAPNVSERLKNRRFINPPMKTMF